MKSLDMILSVTSAVSLLPTDLVKPVISPATSGMLEVVPVVMVNLAVEAKIFCRLFVNANASPAHKTPMASDGKSDDLILT